MSDINNVSEDRVFSKKTGNFETMNMIYKIKKIKKRRNKENMKKMEFPEILENIKSSNEEVPAKIVEGFTFDDDEWEGGDDEYDGDDLKDSESPSEALIRIINYVYNLTVSGNKKLAKAITKTFSNTDTNIESENTDTNIEEFSSYNQINNVKKLNNASENKNENKNEKKNENRKENKKENKNEKKNEKKNENNKKPVDKNDPENDEKLVYRYICFIEAVIFSSFVVNNWYYLMFFNRSLLEKEEEEKKIDSEIPETETETPTQDDEVIAKGFEDEKGSEKKITGGDDQPTGGDDQTVKGVKMFRFSVEYIKKLSNNSIVNKFLKYIVLYFVEYALYFPQMLETFVIKIFPGFISKFMNQTLCYLVLFLIILNISYHFASGFKNFLIDTIKGNYENIIVGIMYMIVFVMYMIDFIMSFMPPEESENSDESDEKSKLAEMNKTYSKKGGKLSVAFFALKIIHGLFIRLILVMGISVPFGGILCLFYFVFYSIFAMLFYSNWDILRLKVIYKEMLKFIDNTKIDIPKKFNPKTGKEEHTFFETLILKINEYVEYISDNFLIITFLITFIYGATDVANNVNNSNLRTILLFLFISFIFIVVTFLFYVIKSKFNISSLDDASGLLNKMTTNIPVEEKDYDSSVTSYFYINLAIYISSLGLVSYAAVKFLIEL